MKRLVLFLLLSAGALNAAETILDFHSRIEVQHNGDLLVTEKITVQAEGQQIKRGIYRDFPTLYQASYGLKISVPFEVLGLRRDGTEESWKSNRQKNGVRIYFGRADYFLPPGRYTYEFRYRTGRQLRFSENADELYWNVTGNGWIFPIEKATAEIVLPEGAHPLEINAYTGPQGSQGKNFESETRGDRVFFRTTRPLGSHEGLTISITWPKGHVAPPAAWEGWIHLVSGNLGAVLGLLAITGVGAYYFAAWLMVGRDPDAGVIIPRYAPPEGLTPAAVRYVRGMGTLDNESVSAMVIDLAVAGNLKIDTDGAADYTLKRTSSPPPLNAASAGFLEALFRSGRTLAIDQKNHTVLQSARSTLLKAVSEQCDGVYFHKHTAVWAIGLAATLVPLGLSLFSAEDAGLAIFLMVFFCFWAAGTLGLVKTAISSRRNPAGIVGAVAAVPFCVVTVGVFALIIWKVSLWVAVIYALGISLTILFHHLLKRPTPEGQRTRDAIEGFRRYLSVAEKDRLNLENPPERTPGLFEKFLPYALALNVGQEWSEQFAEVFANAQYSPDWYGGSHPASFTSAAFAANMSSSFTSAISSSSTAPGSSSGSGGGSSGGGGGGGGGGGW